MKAYTHLGLEYIRFFLCGSDLVPSIRQFDAEDEDDDVTVELMLIFD